MTNLIVLITFILIVMSNAYSNTTPDFSEFGEWLSSCDVSQAQDIDEMVADCEQTRIDHITLDPVEAFYKCHLIFVGNIPSSDSQLLDDVIKGIKTAPVACSELLARGNFDANNLIANTIPNQQLPHLADFDPIAVKIVSRIHNFHKSLFPKKDGFAMGMISGTPYNVGAEFLYDVYSSGAYYFDRAFFNTSIHVSDTLTTTEYLRPVRVQWDPNSHLRDPVATRGYTHATSKMTINYSATVNSDPNSKWEDFLNLGAHAFMPRGVLVGVEPAQSLVIPQLPGNSVPVQHTSIDLFQNHGKGWFCSPDFLINALSQTNKTRANGGTAAARATMNWLYGDFLQLRIPMLRHSDVLNLVQAKASTGPGAPPFRNSSNCMSCHAGADGAAAALRNLEIGGLADKAIEKINGVNNISTLYVRSINPTMGPWNPAEDVRATSQHNNFRLHNPDGVLFFRDHAGNLVEDFFTGCEGMATALAATDQYYIALANHYMKFVTGYSADIQDPGHPTAVALSTEEVDLKAFVVSLGLQLKQDGDPQAIIGQILNSQYFLLNGGGFYE